MNKWQMAFIRPPLRDRALLNLLSYTGFEEAHEVPQGLTQMGMARALGCKRAQVAQVLIELKDRSMVRERVCHIRGSPRRMKAFVLTPDGRSLGENLKRSVLERTVQFIDEDGEPQELTAKDVLNQYPKQLDMTAFIRLVSEDGALYREKVTEYIEKGHQDGKGECLVPEVKAPVAPAPDEEKEVDDAAEAAPVPATTPAEGPVMLECEGTETQVEVPAPTTMQTDGMELGTAAPVEAPPPPYVPNTLYYGYGQGPPMALVPPPQPQPKPRSLFARGSLLLGFTLIFVGGMMPFVVSSFNSELCVFAVFLFIMGIALMVSYYVGLRMAKVDKLTKGDRYSVLIVALILGYILAFLASLLFDFNWDLNRLYSFLAITIPLCFVLGAFFLIPAETRGQLGIIIGTFMIALGVGGLEGGKAFDWVYIHPVMWLATGVMAATVGNEVARPDRRRIGLWVSTGIGVYMAVAAVALMNYSWTAKPEDLIIRTDKLVIVAVLALWLVLGIIIIALRAAGKERLDGIYSGLGYTAIVCIGTAFFMFGIWFMKLGRFEGVIDLFVGLPVVYYSLVQLKESHNPQLKLVAGIMGYAVIVEVLSLGLLLKIY